MDYTLEFGTMIVETRGLQSEVGIHSGIHSAVKTTQGKDTGILVPITQLSTAEVVQ